MQSRVWKSLSRGLKTSRISSKAETKASFIYKSILHKYPSNILSDLFKYPCLSPSTLKNTIQGSLSSLQTQNKTISNTSKILICLCCRKSLATRELRSISETIKTNSHCWTAMTCFSVTGKSTICWENLLASFSTRRKSTKILKHRYPYPIDCETVPEHLT